MMNKFLKFIKFSELTYWTAKRYFITDLKLTNKYPQVLFGKFLAKYSSKIINIEDEKVYKIIGVRSYGKGAYINREVQGQNLNMKKYQLVEPNLLLWCKVDTKNGAFGIVTENLVPSYASSNMALAKINNNLIANDYLQLLFTCPQFHKYLDLFVSGTTNRKYIKIDELLTKIKIPLPLLEKQKEIVDRYNEKIKLAEEQAKEAQNLEEMIEQYICSELKIVNTSPKVSNEFKISFVNYKDLSRWGVEFLKNNLSSKDFLKSLVYPMKKLGTLVAINPDNDFSKLDENLEMTFLPMASISDKFGEIVNAEKGKNEDSNGYTKFKEGDLLWAKITPCMQNGKSAIAKNLINNRGYGSTEFYVIRNKNENELYFDYIYHLLRTKIIRETATKYFTGSSGQQRVPKSFLENLSIPLPDFYKQKQISDELYKIKHKIKELTYTAEQNRQLAQEEFEKELFE